MSFWLFLKSRWPLWKKRPNPSIPPPPRGEPYQPGQVEPASALQVPLPSAAEIAPPPFELVEPTESEEDDELELYDDDETDALSDDPFISSGSPEPTFATAESIALIRRNARALALSGEHKIYLTDQAGPGSLAEALKQLLEEGAVVSEFRDGDLAQPYILYRPT